MKLWTSLLSGELDPLAEQYNRSIEIDGKMLQEDLLASIAHVKMLGQQGILTKDESDLIVSGLQDLLSEYKQGELEIDLTAEDVHTFVEATLTKRIGSVAGKMHTARSRNDQVVTDFRLKIIHESDDLIEALCGLVQTIAHLADQHRSTIMPGMTHLQPAQAITFAHHLLAWGFSIKRDIERLKDALKRIRENPLGSCALAGTTFSLDRSYTTKELGFDQPMPNSLDAVSARDFVLEVLSVLAIMHSHYSRISEELVLWSTVQFGYIRLSEQYVTGSSIMPQKINPDIAELVRGKTGRVYGHLMQGLTMVKGLPLAYSKDLQEDKAALFDAFKTCLHSTILLNNMLSTMTVNEARMLDATERGYLQATDLADYLVRKGLPFREAHHVVAQIVAHAMASDRTLSTLKLDEYQSFHPDFDVDLYEVIDLNHMVESRQSEGGPASCCTAQQIEILLSDIKAFQTDHVL